MLLKLQHLYKIHNFIDFHLVSVAFPLFLLFFVNDWRAFSFDVGCLLDALGGFLYGHGGFYYDFECAHLYDDKCVHL